MRYLRKPRRESRLQFLKQPRILFDIWSNINYTDFHCHLLDLVWSYAWHHLAWVENNNCSKEKVHEVQTIAVDLYFSLSISKLTLRKLSKLILNRQSELESNFSSSTAEK